MKHCCTHTDTNLMIHLLPVKFSPAKMMLLCINSTKVNQYAGIFPPSVKMVLTEEDEVIIALCLIIMAVAMQNLEGRQVMRRIWTRPWILRRKIYGAHHALIEELRNEDPKGLKNFLRMDLQTFEELLHMVTPLIQKKDTRLRDSIPPAERLSLTLRFLATGNIFHLLFLQNLLYYYLYI